MELTLWIETLRLFLDSKHQFTTCIWLKTTQEFITINIFKYIQNCDFF